MRHLCPENKGRVYCVGIFRMNLCMLSFVLIRHACTTLDQFPTTAVFLEELRLQIAHYLVKTVIFFLLCLHHVEIQL